MRPVRLQKRRHPLLNLLLFSVALAAGIIWAEGESLAGRAVTLRYLLLLATALIAFLTPYLLFPDSNLAMLQLGNVAKRSLRCYILNKFWRINWPLYVFFAALIFTDFSGFFSATAHKFMIFTGAIAFLAGLQAYALKRYIRLGGKSQFWKESDRGKKLRVQMANYLKYPIDPGSIPSLLSTILILLIGSVTLIAGSALGTAVGLPAETGTCLLLFAGGFAYFLYDGSHLMRNFLLSDAFYREFFRVSRKGDPDATQREAEQLWWVPRMIRPSVWQLLLQLDRKLPAGRVVAAGHLLLLVIAYQRPEPAFLFLLWMIFAVSHHILIWMSASDQITPAWLQRYTGGARVWILIRSWMQVRWTVPLMLGMNLQLFIFGTPDLTAQLLILAVYLLTAFAFSLIAGFKSSRDFST